jgi:hypothetical protein
LNADIFNKHKIRRVYDRDVAGLLMEMSAAQRTMNVEIDNEFMKYIASWEEDTELWIYCIETGNGVQEKGFAKIIFGEYLSHYPNEYWFDVLSAKLP